MIRVTSPYLKKDDRELLKHYSKFVLNRFVRNSIIRKSDFNIKVLRKEDLTEKEDYHDMKKYGAWIIHTGLDNGRRKFTLILSATHINKNAKKNYKRLKKVMLDLGHEMVHAKQYLNNELFDYVSGDVRYKGDVYNYDMESDEAYYDSPWEIEAYGREWGLYKMFVSKMKEEAKATK